MALETKCPQRARLVGGPRIVHLSLPKVKGRKDNDAAIKPRSASREVQAAGCQPQSCKPQAATQVEWAARGREEGGWRWRE